MDAHTKIRWMTAQADLFAHCHDAAKHCPAMSAPELIPYEKSFKKLASQSFKASTLGEITKNILASSLVLYGDFHPLAQSQQGFLEIVSDVLRQSQGRQIKLLLEFFSTSDQRWIDKYMDDQISEELLLKKVHYQSTWGFQWESFRRVLQFAKTYGLEVYGLNQRRTSKSKASLERRDRDMGRVVAEIHERSSEAILCVLVGEFHLVDHGMLKTIRELVNDPSFRMIRVLSNVERVYFDHFETIVSGLGSNFFRCEYDLYCMVNTAPWIKWKSYSVWEELASLRSVEGDENEANIDDLFFDITLNLAAFANYRGDRSALQDFSMFLGLSPMVKSALKEKLRYTQYDLDVIDRELNAKGFMLFDDIHWLVILDSSLNTLTRAAGEFLFHIAKGSTRQRKYPNERSNQEILRAAAGLFAAKIFDPKFVATDEWSSSDPQGRSSCVLAESTYRKLIAGEASLQSVMDLFYTTALDVARQTEFFHAIPKRVASDS
jgi:hypothetical protein